MEDLKGFWSYVHKDDESDRGRISELARDVVSEFEMLTGDTIELFLDKDALEWGANWRSQIDTSLSSVGFFVPVMTPRYFLSAECRRELTFLVERATALGLKELVLPLLYVEVPALVDDTSPDKLIVMLRTFQWEDWTDIRYADRTSGEYRRGVSRLAQRLVKASRQVEPQAVELVDRVEARSLEEEESGLVDKLAAGEEAMPAMTESLAGIAGAIEEIGTLLSAAGEEISSPRAPQTFSHRARVAKKVAEKLWKPTNQISHLSDPFIAQLSLVDITIRTILELVREQETIGEEEREQIVDFLNMVSTLSRSANAGLSQGAEFTAMLTTLEKTSRDFRPIVRKLRGAMTKIIQGKEVTDSWIPLLENLTADVPALELSEVFATDGKAATDAD